MRLDALEFVATQRDDRAMRRNNLILAFQLKNNKPSSNGPQDLFIFAPKGYACDRFLFLLHRLLARAGHVAYSNSYKNVHFGMFLHVHTSRKGSRIFSSDEINFNMRTSRKSNSGG